MSKETGVDIAKLRELEAKATKGPWKLGEYDETGGYDCKTGSIDIGPAVLDGWDYGQPHCEEIPTDGLERMQSDASLIAAMRNALPDLLHEVERLRLRIAKADRIIMTLTEHDNGAIVASYMSEYGDSPDNAAIDAAHSEVDRLMAVIQRGADLCERGHGHEWASEARAALQGASK